METEKLRCEGAMLDDGNFDEEYDVVVVGYGFGGGVAGIEAARCGARVLICEKMPQAGGISICSGGSVRCARSAQDAYDYLKATNAGTTPDDVSLALAEGMATARSYVKGLISDLPGVTLKAVAGKDGGNYPFPGWETFYSTQVQLPPAIDLRRSFPGVRTRPSSGAPAMFWVIDSNVRKLGVEVRLQTAVRGLIRTADNEIRGVLIDGPSGARRIATRCGVVLACGGFEADEDMKTSYWEGKPVPASSTRGNTGDGIRMAQAVGADLWHMWHFHGCYAFRHSDPTFPFALRVKRLPDWNPARKDGADVPMVWIIVDQSGRRYMNESPPYCQDTAHRPMHFIDPETMRYPRNPSYLITDETGKRTYPLGDVRINDHEYDYEWSGDNSRELELKILRQAHTVEDLARLINADPSVLASTIDRWNFLCDLGEDQDFGRPRGTMKRIDTPPYIVGEVLPAVSNTQGGPVHNARQQILNIMGEPIPRLYAAGELGSSFGHLYLSGGNIAECFVTGWIAGREVARLN